MGASAGFVSESLGIGNSTAYRYVDSYKEKGLSDNLKYNWVACWGVLSVDQLSDLKEKVKNRLYTTTAQVQAWIKETFGVVYKARLLHRLGFVCKKPKHVPCGR